MVLPPKKRMNRKRVWKTGDREIGRGEWRRVRRKKKRAGKEGKRGLGGESMKDHGSEKKLTNYLKERGHYVGGESAETKRGIHLRKKENNAVATSRILYAQKKRI